MIKIFNFLVSDHLYSDLLISVIHSFLILLGPVDWLVLLVMLFIISYLVISGKKFLLNFCQKMFLKI